MPHPLSLFVLLLLAAPAAAVDTPPSALDGRVLAQMIVRERIIIRMSRPALPRATAIPIPPPPEPKFDEKKGPKCVAVRELAGSASPRKRSVDLAMTDGTRMRARLDDDCPPIDFYAGFYIKRPPDGMLCAERDVIRTRSGGACAISAFRKLKPKR